jgi:hypothetical protein
MPDRPFVDPELAAEQAYVDAAYARLEAMRAAAERVRAHTPTCARGAPTRPDSSATSRGT